MSTPTERIQESIIDSYRLILVFVMPIGLNNIGWKMYMINGGWDVIVVVLIVSINGNIHTADLVTDV